MFKKLLFTLAISAISTSFYAQKDISVTMTAPAAGTNFQAGTPVDVEFTVTNTGVDTLFVGDSVYHAITVNGYNISGSYIFLVTRTNDTVPPSGSWNYTRTVNFSNIPSSGSADMCVVVSLWDGGASAVVESDSTNNKDCRSMNFTAGSTAGIDGLSLEGNASVKAYPNPATDVVTFEITGTNDARNVTITNLAGQVVVNQEIITGTATVDVSSLKSGMYIYTVYGENKVLGSHKITVK